MAAVVRVPDVEEATVSAILNIESGEIIEN